MPMYVFDVKFIYQLRATAEGKRFVNMEISLRNFHGNSNEMNTNIGLEDGDKIGLFGVR